MSLHERPSYVTLNTNMFVKNQQHIYNCKGKDSQQIQIAVLHPPELVVPVPDVVLVDGGLHLLHLSFIRQNDHHGGVALVWQHDDASVVIMVLVEVVATQPLHHVHLNFGIFVHIEVCLVCVGTIEGFLPLSCVRGGAERTMNAV